jgi:hypothetical protein
LVVGVVVALGVAGIAVAIPVPILIALGAGLVALRRHLWGRGAKDMPSEEGPGASGTDPGLPASIRKRSPARA